MNEEQEVSKIELIYASDFMAEDVLTVNQTETIDQVAHVMLREKVSGYPVCDDDKNIVGIVTMTDLYKLLDKIVLDSRAMPEGSVVGNLPHHISSVKQRPVSEIMVTNIKTISPETSLKDIINDVVDHKIHTFPVVKDGVLVGIIGRHDVLNAVFRYG